MENTIVWFDLETTGLDISNDRIIEICLIKTDTSGNEIAMFKTKVNPEGVKSRPEAFEKHGITDESLLDEDTFKYIAPSVVEFIGDSDLGGYNIIRYDLPLLIEEFIRAGVPFNYRSRAIVDPYKILAKYEPRGLGATYTRLTGKKIENAHKAEDDVRATMEVFNIQQKLYNLPHELGAIDNIVNKRENQVDLGGKFIIGVTENSNKPEVLFNFGKWKGQSFTHVFKTSPDYLNWMIDKGDFTQETKLIIKKLQQKISQK